MLLKELDYIPLAITQAAAFVKRNKLTSLEFYLSKLCQHLQVQDVLSYELRDARRQPGTPSAIFRTWQISYQQIKLDNTEAASKLSLMAVLDNQAIPQMLLAKGEALEMAEIDAIQVLLDFSLIKGDEQYRFFSMHPLQQLVSGSDPENICLPGCLLVTCCVMVCQLLIFGKFYLGQVKLSSLFTYRM